MLKPHPNFTKMDELSLQKVPYFFMVDFLGEAVNVFTEKDLQDSGIKIQFPAYTNTEQPEQKLSHLDFNAFPPSEENYKLGFEIVQKNLRLGNSYLTNFTCQSEIDLSLSLEDIFYLSKARYKVIVPNQFVFFSPETFVEIKQNQIYTYPMKGTIDAAIPGAADLLKENPKEKAEHYTVVDLLRNDLSQIATAVQVDEFQRIDFIKTNDKDLYAMSSKISGTLRQDFKNKIGTLMRNLLPAGSILGAPKEKTLEIILEAENYHRGYYTGVCGWFDGENLDSCVMIRFIEKEKDKLYFKSGGGITHLSNFADEYQEMKNKIYVPIH